MLLSNTVSEDKLWETHRMVSFKHENPKYQSDCVK